MRWIWLVVLVGCGGTSPCEPCENPLPTVSGEVYCSCGGRLGVTAQTFPTVQAGPQCESQKAQWRVFAAAKCR
jgi:hypothetical protein